VHVIVKFAGPDDSPITQRCVGPAGLRAPVAADDTRISAAFRRICADNGGIVQRLAGA